jgi:S1-C subfamily serine protease
MRVLRNLFITILAFCLLSNGILALPSGQAFFGKLEGMRQFLPVNTFVAKTNTEGLGDREQTLVSLASPSVVFIYSLQYKEASGSPVYRRGRLGSFVDAARRRISPVAKISSGTGFFVDEDGYILTNNHVVADEGETYTVILPDGRQKKAEVVSRDGQKDLAVLKISGGNYPVLPLGDSANVRIGDEVLGLGNTLGMFELTVSEGQVARTRRTIYAEGDGPPKLSNLIQTTAQFYPGDSGGPLLNLKGEVVGINVAAAIDKANVGFSIPINDAKAELEAIAD